MKKKKKQKNPAFNLQSSSTREPSSISKHEDVALKVTAQFFKEELMPMLNIKGNVVSVLPTEEIHLELKKGFEDFNYLMEDDTIKHFEFQSTNEGITGLKRFRVYEAQLSLRHDKAVTTYVLFSGVIKNPMTEYAEGVNTYRIVPIIMQNKNADIVIAELKQKVSKGVEITKADLLPLVLCPLMSGTMSQKERISTAYDITRQATIKDVEVIRKVEAVIYIMADKFLDSVEMEQLKEEIKMTRLGKMLYDDGKIEGQKRAQTCVFTLIQKMTADGELEAIPKLTTDPEFYQAMVEKYQIEV
ncbi:MAG: hypothetical protein IJA54_06415 [Tyzzerella sp.]|nr:hypothetical protein [Tyzzerella sp.]